MAKVVSEFWRGKKVFLTGHTGFKGSWLSLWLCEMGAQVVGYALRPSTQPSLFEDLQLDQKLQSHIADVRDLETLCSKMREANPEIVIHMAAQPLVRYSYEYPVETYMTNVMGTVHLLEAVRKTPSVRAVVNVTSDKCYENREWHWGYRENEAMGGYDPYSNSKGCAELVTSAYRQSFFSDPDGVQLASGRAGNVIGAGDWAQDRLLPDIVRGFLMGQTVEIRSPKSVRPWQHVLEPVSGYLMLAQKLYESGADFAQAFNFGPADEDAKEVGWIVSRMAELWGEGASFQIHHDANAVHEAKLLKLDCSKAKHLLRWRPHWGLEQALQSIVEFSREYKVSKLTAEKIVLQQIKQFVQTS